MDYFRGSREFQNRVTNGTPELVVKIGSWGGTEQRKELSVFTKPGEFDKLTEIFAALGYKKGMLCMRKSKVYEYQEIEFALVEVPGHSYYYEAEKMASGEEDANKIIKEIKGVCADLELTVFDRREFFDYVHQLNKEANEVFEYKSDSVNYFQNRFKL